MPAVLTGATNVELLTARVLTSASATVADEMFVVVVLVVVLAPLDGDGERANAIAAFSMPTASTPVLSAVCPLSEPGIIPGAEAECGVESTESFRTSGSAIDGRFVGLRERPIDPPFSSSSGAHH